eukprot:2171200-Pleurochrysis_carterae.AAC.1
MTRDLSETNYLPFGLTTTEVLIYQSIQIIKSGRIRMDNCHTPSFNKPSLASNRGEGSKRSNTKCYLLHKLVDSISNKSDAGAA